MMKSINDNSLAIVEYYLKSNKSDVIKDNDVAYILSCMRENIINWYTFNKEAEALLIDGYHSGLNELLSFRLNLIDSLEFEDYIAFQNKHHSTNNTHYITSLEVKKYDYIILNSDISNAYALLDVTSLDSLINLLKDHLTKKGTILLVCNNKLSISLFNGEYDKSVKGYYSFKNRYSKKQLSKIIQNQDLTCKFFYPYPNAIYPNEIFTDKSLYSLDFNKYKINTEDTKLALFDEKQVLNILQQEHVVDTFMNSFLLEITNYCSNSDLIYSKISKERQEQFQICTNIYESNNVRYVKKLPLTSSAYTHILQIRNNENQLNQPYIKALSTKDENELVYDYLNLQNLDQIVEEKGFDMHAVIKEMQSFFDHYFSVETKNSNRFYNETFKKWFGNTSSIQNYECIKKANIDLIFDNIYKKENQYIVIDNEWYYPDYVPKKLVIWRAINEACTKHMQLESHRGELLEAFSISLDDESLFREWSNYFAREYVGKQYLLSISKEMITVDMMDYYLNHRKYVEMTLYYDQGEGFNEQHSIKQLVDITKNQFTIQFDLSNINPLQALRLDVLEGSYCKCRINMDALSNATFEYDGYNVFYTLDPQYYIDCNHITNDMLEIEGRLYLLTINDVIKYQSDLIKKNEKVEKKRHLFRKR